MRTFCLREENAANALAIEKSRAAEYKIPPRAPKNCFMSRRTAPSVRRR